MNKQSLPSGEGKKLLLIIFIFTTVVVFLIILGKEKSGLVGPNISPQPSSVPPQFGGAGPKTFQFDSLTDLNAELEKVNPQVLDSDFNE